MFSAWRFHAKQSSLVKKYLQEVDFKSGSNESLIKSPPNNKAISHIRQDSNQEAEYLDYKENSGPLSLNHPNVRANDDLQSKYY